ncbi:SGNH/GDSL hydrolase family protein [Amycolatopsis sp. FBCC-B4732]|uniref:SGNH/GDSL hydrolase family protein n=1 Tax=Amycolatopsis sp. FBCC-B4732 TaxID=3079339 RepID=UPI001FF662E5|nr:SGNH/GDSL hydrolase family protein [Amycolatopsis sp. FBCC-B4732]UOX92683.1 SGNH/GDSL hydrolase family protein [Amycolatopsis sp. FBCC-B4732]
MRIALVVALLAGLMVAPAATAGPLRYVALGDSSAAGPGIPVQIDATCLRSDHDWPHVLAARLGAALTDVTCSGATTADLTGRQAGVVAPQFAALRRDTALVTLAIGANDIALGSAFVTCASPDAPVSPSCEEQYATVFPARIAATAPKIAAALEEIHRRSPAARVVVTGYLTYWRPGGCYPADPFTAADAGFIQATFDRLMTMLADQSRRHGASYVDIREPSARHGLCAGPAGRWLEGAVPASPAYPYHPNAAGMAAAAGIIGARLGSPSGTRG